MATTVGRQEIQGIMQHFEEIPDPRSTVNRTHLLTEVIVMSICAVIAGADGPAGIEEWAKRKHDWLKQHLQLPGGIPSHDTFGRILQALDPQAFQQCFAGWLDSLFDEGDERRQVAIDGKTMRRSHDRRRGLGPLHMVSAWATEQGIALGQLATEEKSNEITAIPQLLDQLDIEAAILSIDAAGCQKEIAGKIIAGGGDYVLALKGNQGNLFEAVRDYILDHMEDGFARVTVSRWEEKEKVATRPPPTTTTCLLRSYECHASMEKGCLRGRMKKSDFLHFPPTEA